MTIETAVNVCRNSDLTGWALVEYTQKLVNQNMTYSFSHSLDSPREAFEKGRGYCWHQASALQMILAELGFTCRLVHAVRNRFPARTLEGVRIPEHVSGHVLCRVTLDGIEKDICPGNPDNRPGFIHFKPLSKVVDWNSFIAFWSYWGSALVNARRLKRFEHLKEKQASKWNPERCPCRKASCPRHGKCNECKEYHYSKGGLPRCER